MGGNRFSAIWFTDNNLYISCENTGVSFASTSLGASGWFRVAVSYDGTTTGNANRLRCWVNGQTRSLTFSGTIPATLGSVSPWTLGRDSIDRHCGGRYADNRVMLRTIDNDWASRDYEWSLDPSRDPRLRRLTGVATLLPMGGTVHELTASGITTGTPTLGSPTITQTHALTATGLATGTPTLGTPGLTQTHSLTASSLTAGTPTIDSPALTQTHVLAASGLAAGTPALGTPAISQIHTLAAVSITTGTPTLGSPALTIITPPTFVDPHPIRATLRRRSPLAATLARRSAITLTLTRRSPLLVRLSRTRGG